MISTIAPKAVHHVVMIAFSCYLVAVCKLPILTKTEVLPTSIQGIILKSLFVSKVTGFLSGGSSQHDYGGYVSLAIHDLGGTQQVNWTLCSLCTITFSSSLISLSTSCLMPETDSWSSPPPHISIQTTNNTTGTISTGLVWYFLLSPRSASTTLIMLFRKCNDPLAFNNMTKNLGTAITVVEAGLNIFKLCRQRHGFQFAWWARH